MANAAGGQRVDPAEFRGLRLRAHEFLTGIPLHDVWRIRLEGGPPDITVREILEGFSEMGPTRLNRSARLLFALRTGLGRLFGWDREDPTARERSYLNRLTTEDRARSLDEPGSSRGFWTTVYTFEHEAVGEVMNRTVHAFLVFALADTATDERTLYWGIYVKPVSRLTRFYMAMIDPFRRIVIYPAVIRRFEEAWRDHSAPGAAPGAGKSGNVPDRGS